MSIEAGQRVALGGVWSLTLQAQLSYPSVTDDFTDTFGTRVSLAESNSFIGRLGVTIDREMTWLDQQGCTSRSYVFGMANLYHDFEDGSRVYVGDTAFASENDALWGDRYWLLAQLRRRQIRGLRRGAGQDGSPELRRQPRS